MATVYSSDRDGGGLDVSVEDVLLRNYHTMDVLDFPIDYGVEMFLKCLQREREDRLYALWVAYYTNPFGGKDRKSWEEFKGTSSPSDTSTGANVGKISGVDLTKVRK